MEHLCPHFVNTYSHFREMFLLLLKSVHGKLNYNLETTDMETYSDSPHKIHSAKTNNPIFVSAYG